MGLYRDREERIRSLDEDTKIPVMYDGVVARVLEDFLGMSVIVDHPIHGMDNFTFCTIYGHIVLKKDLKPGKTINGGEIIGGLADTGRSKTNILPHLHLTIGKASKKICYDDLSWRSIGSGRDLKLLDPLTVLDADYQEVESGLSPCRDL